MNNILDLFLLLLSIFLLAEGVLCLVFFLQGRGISRSFISPRRFHAELLTGKAFVSKNETNLWNRIMLLLYSALWLLLGFIIFTTFTGENNLW